MHQLKPPGTATTVRAGMNLDLLQAAAIANMISLVRDAARYHWLRSTPNEATAAELVRCCDGKELDAEIDKAMAAESMKIARVA